MQCAALLRAYWVQIREHLQNLKSALVSIFGKGHLSVIELCRPGLRYGPTPVRGDFSDRRTWFDRLVLQCLSYRERHQFTELNSAAWLERMALCVQKLGELTPIQLDADRRNLSQALRLGSSTEELLDDALAHTLIAVERTLQLMPRANQRLAARAMLRGHFVEMATGEGKTLSVAMAVGAAALSGTPTHVLTANEYLAERDASYLQPFYQFLGLHVASVVSGQQYSERREAYTADIVYATAKQLAFDWLNESLEMGARRDALTTHLRVLTQIGSRTRYRPMLRGLCLGFVDEADSLLVDEARIPLVLSTSQSSSTEHETEAVIALGLAENFREGIDFIAKPTAKIVSLTDQGRTELARISANVTHVWQSSRFREERVTQALAVLHRYQKDRDYIVREGRLELMDANTGRAMPDRRLPHGLHLLLELKEKCKPSPEHETVASLPFQHFFRCYISLAGISGTLREVAGEIHQVYDACVVQVPPHQPSQLVNLPARVFNDRASQLQTMVREVQRRKELEQPVLVCTRSVEQSLGVSAMLSAKGLPHQVLNAYQDAEEAQIVATAGQAGQITVATNMAGRGTDIPLGPKIAQSDGLHVISLAFNDARRLDRQLAGRAARQGDPGSHQQLFCLDDPYLVEATTVLTRQCARICVERKWHRAALLLVRFAQRRMECKHRTERLKLYKSRERLEQQLAFGGRQETTF